MNGLPYYKRYPRDLIEGTVGMPFELKVTYAFVLDLIYLQGGALPDDPRYISGVLGVSVRKWNSLRNALLETGKIQEQNGKLSNYRAIIELESLGKFQDKQRENRSRPNKNKDLQKPRSHHTDTDTEDTNKLVSTAKRGTRLSEDWFLPVEWGQWALSEGWAEPGIRAEADKFKDHWISKAGRDGTKRDWQATWRNWMRNSKQPKLSAINGGSNDTPDHPDRFHGIIAAAARGSSGKDWG